MTKPKWKIVDQNRRSIHPTKNSKYSKKYIKGKIVKSQPGSFGLFCFKHKHQAVTFLNFCLALNDSLEIGKSGYLILYSGIVV